MYASMGGHVGSMELLLKAGADPDLKDEARPQGPHERVAVIIGVHQRAESRVLLQDDISTAFSSFSSDSSPVPTSGRVAWNRRGRRRWTSYGSPRSLDPPLYSYHTARAPQA